MILAAGLAWVWAAYGISTVGFILPLLRVEWQINYTQQGLLAALGLLGMMAGSIISGYLADRIGRRRALYLALLWAGLFSLFSSQASSFVALTILRLLTGAGLGAILPGTSALVSEYAPVRIRGALLVLLNGFWGVGFALAAAVSWLLVPRLGWQAVYYFGGLTILTILAVRQWLPESLRFLFAKNRTMEAQGIIQRFGFNDFPDQPGPAASPAVPQAAAPAGIPARQGIWSAHYRGRTIRLWILWFSLNFLFQGVFIWLPTLLQNTGYNPEKASIYTMAISLGQVPGSVIAAFLVDRVGRRASLAVFLALYALSCFIFGLSSSLAAILVWGFLISLCNGAAWGMAYPYTTELYPTRIRAAAVGWATGMGRTGGIVAPLLIGQMIGVGAATSAVYTLLAAEAALTILVLLGLRHETAGQTLEEASR